MVFIAVIIAKNRGKVKGERGKFSREKGNARFLSFYCANTAFRLYLLKRFLAIKCFERDF
jgi:hypothetical protein